MEVITILSRELKISRFDIDILYSVWSCLYNLRFANRHAHTPRACTIATGFPSDQPLHLHCRWRFSVYNRYSQWHWWKGWSALRLPLQRGDTSKCFTLSAEVSKIQDCFRATLQLWTDALLVHLQLLQCGNWEPARSGNASNFAFAGCFQWMSKPNSPCCLVHWCTYHHWICSTTVCSSTHGSNEKNFTTIRHDPARFGM